MWGSSEILELKTFLAVSPALHRSVKGGERNTKSSWDCSPLHPAAWRLRDPANRRSLHCNFVSAALPEPPTQHLRGTGRSVCTGQCSLRRVENLQQKTRRQKKRLRVVCCEKSLQNFQGKSYLPIALLTVWSEKENNGC